METGPKVEQAAGASYASVAKRGEAIPERPGLSYSEFAREYLFPGRPVVIPDALSQWSAVGKWTPDYFRTNFGTREVTIDGRKYTVRELIDLIESSSRDRPSPYYRNDMVREVFPELLADLSPLPPYVLPNWFRGPFYPSVGREAEIYIGGAGCAFPLLHYDSNSTHAFLGQVYGQKQAILYSRDQTHLMYPREGNKERHHSQVDLQSPDLEKFPLFADAVPFTGVLRPGSLLFIPARWWHIATMQEPSITISFNVANASNWNLVTDEMRYKARCTNQLLVGPVHAYMTLTGWYKALWDRMTGQATPGRPSRN